MADSKITDLTELATADVAQDDLVEVVDTSASANKKAKVSSIIAPSSASKSASFTFSAAEANRTTVVDSASAIVATIPTNASVAYPLGTKLRAFRKGAGTVKITPDSGVTLRLPTGISPARTMGVRAKLASDLTSVNPSGVYTIPWNAEAWDTDGFHDTVTNNSRLTIPSNLGIKKVSVSASLYMSSLTSNVLAVIGIQKGGSAIYDGFTQSFSTSTGVVTAEFSCASGDIATADSEYFTAVVYSSDTSVTLASDRTGMSLTVTEIDAQGWVAYQYGAVEIEKIGTDEWIVTDRSALG